MAVLAVVLLSIGNVALATQAPPESAPTAAPPPAPATAPRAPRTAPQHERNDTSGDKRVAVLPLFPLRVRWTAELDSPPSAPIATDNVRVYVPLATGGMLGIDATLGAPVWKADVTTSLRPVAADGHVYVVGEDALQALDGGTGQAAWRVTLPSAVSAPIVARAGWVIAALTNGEILALRGTDGTIVWRQLLASPLVAEAAIDGDRLYVPGADGVVRALDVSSGATIWTRTLGGSIVTITPLGGRLYVGSTDNYFYCLDDARGRVRWRWRAGADPVGSATADEERIYFASLDTVLRALDRGHGAQRWRQPLPWRPRTGPLKVGHTLVASGVAVDLRGYDLATGKPVGEFALTEARLEVLEGQPVVIARTTLPGDFLVAAVADGRLIALEHVFGLPAVPLTALPGERVALTPPPAS